MKLLNHTQLPASENLPKSQEIESVVEKASELLKSDQQRNSNRICLSYFKVF